MGEDSGEGEITFEDVETYRKEDEKISFWSIALKQYDHCIKEGSKEMQTGGIMERVINGERIQMIVPNQREIFINSVRMLYGVLTPLVKKHMGKKKECEESFGSINKRMDELEKAYDPEQYMDMPELDDPEYQKDPESLKQYYFSVVDRLNDKKESKLIELHRKLLIELAFIMASENYGSERSV